MQRNALSWCNRTLNRQVVNKTAGLDQETLLLDAMFEIPGSDMVTAARDSSTSTPVLQPGSSSTPVLQPSSSSTPVLQPGSSSTPVLQPDASSDPVLQPGRCQQLCFTLAILIPIICRLSCCCCWYFSSVTQTHFSLLSFLHFRDLFFVLNGYVWLS
ncbi:uncharacterized protein LOC143022758 isoform X2 [Oratosquilla oratoria]|uniref:uncharacterized protein LOC143022758 isoform X2 n=1 Tax=Oratosquilla oratoria TaxID=337810 RepID=UPI003F770E17